MDDSLIVQLGVGGIFAILIIREVLNFLHSKTRNGNGDKSRQEMSRKIDDLHEWHNQRDNAGIFLWYHRPYLEQLVQRLADNIQAQTTILRELCYEVRNMRQDVRRSRTEMEDNESWLE